MNERTEKQTARRARGGFTLAETLLTVLILLLVSGSIAGGMTFAVRQYRESMQLSQAKVLCSTLTSVVRSELANTVVMKPGDPPSFDGRAFSEGTGEGDKSQLLLGGMPLLSGTSYTSNKLGARIAVEWQSAGERVKLFEVTLTILDSAGEELLTSAFDVLPLNETKIETD